MDFNAHSAQGFIKYGLTVIVFSRDRAHLDKHLIYNDFLVKRGARLAARSL
jgi:hypothetical protein